MSNPIVIGIITGVVSSAAGAITSQLTRGDLNLIPSIVFGLTGGVAFGAITRWQNNKKSQANSDDSNKWNVWSAFQSDSVREIHANMTDAERSASNRDGLIFGGIYGIWCALSLVGPGMLIALGLISGNLRPAVGFVGVLLIVVHFAFIPVVQRRQRRLLCNTSWARENGIESDTLKLLKWPNKNTTI